MEAPTIRRGRDTICEAGTGEDARKAAGACGKRLCKPIVSFCGEVVGRIGPAQFEVRHRNWRPDRDLAVLIVSAEPQEQAFGSAIVSIAGARLGTESGYLTSRRKRSFWLTPDQPLRSRYKNRSSVRRSGPLSTKRSNAR
jgi:hypothetical protein